MRPVCVLGNGQLGRMLRQAGEQLGITVYPIGIDAQPEAVPHQQSIITAEIERWPETPLTRELALNKRFINRDIFPQLADRFSQKLLLDTLALPTAPWTILTSPSQWPELFDKLGDLLIVKRRTGGYDGRGQWRIKSDDKIDLHSEIYGECIVERAIPFDDEISIIGARNAAGKTVFYPISHNLHQEGILRTSVTYPKPLNQQQEQAESMLSAVLSKLDYVGVMAMECFVVGDRLLINELAPRVHNSGHWTQNGASISQFELHLRAILDLPIPHPEVFCPSVMINLIGTEINLQWLDLALVHLHWYEKEVRPARKVGHLNLSHPDKERLKSTLDMLISQLPTEYQSSIQWAKVKLG